MLPFAFYPDQCPYLKNKIDHWISLTVIGDQAYIYDMPQGEFIADVTLTDMATGNVRIIAPYRPRLIPLTVEEIASNYQMAEYDAANFLKQVLDTRVNNTDIRNFIASNIKDIDYNEYIQTLDDSTKKSLISLKEIYKKKDMSFADIERVSNFIENKLKVKIREYNTSKNPSGDFKNKDTVEGLSRLELTSILDNLGISQWGLNIKNWDSLDVTFDKLKKYFNNPKFQTFINTAYERQKEKVKDIQFGIDELYSAKRLLNNYIKHFKINNNNIEVTLALFDKEQQNTIKLYLPKILGGKQSSRHKSIAQALGHITKKINNNNRFYSSEHSFS